MKLELKACLSVGLLCAVAGFTSLPSLADEVIYRTVETGLAPNLIVTPASSVTTTTTKTIETTPTNSVLVSPADDTISRRTVIFGDRPATKSLSSSEAVVSTSLDNKPNYGERIRLLRSQLDKGISNGWIKPDEAASLSRRLDGIQDREATVRGAGYLKVDCDSFEKELTGYNIDLSHSMEGH